MSATFGHAGIVVSDLDRMIEFLGEALGMKLRHRFRRDGEFPAAVTGTAGADLEIAILGFDGQPQVIELLKYHSHPPAASERTSTAPHTNHVMYLVDDADETHAAIVKAGGEPFTEPILSPNGAKSCFYARDYEGGIFEVIQVIDPSNEYPWSRRPESPTWP